MGAPLDQRWIWASTINMRSPVRSTRSLPDVGRHLVDGLVGFGDGRSEVGPDVDHLLPYLKACIHAGLLGAFGKPGRIIEQHFGGADENQNGRQALEIGVERRCQWIFRVAVGPE